jgi:hypothetical protein
MVFWRFIFEITHHSLKTRQGHNHRTHNGHSGDLGFDAKSGQLEINPQCPQISTTPASNIINTATAATSDIIQKTQSQGRRSKCCSDQT